MLTPEKKLAKTILLLGLTALFMVCPLSATTVDTDRMEQVCHNWLRYLVHSEGSWAGSSTPQVIAVDDITVEGRLLGRCFAIAPDGYVVVPVLRELSPIKAFSETGRLDFDDNSEPCDLIRDDLRGHIDDFAVRYGDMGAAMDDKTDDAFAIRIHNAWNRLLLDEKEFDAYLMSKGDTKLEEVGPLLTTAWSQTTPYNNYCPPGDGATCVVWCLATALAQILNYHQWPPAGFGNHLYWWDGDNSCGGTTPGRTIYANFADRLQYNETTHDVAELSYECGVPYSVDYGVCYSIGYPDPIMTFLPAHFAYAFPITKLRRNNYAAFEWFAAIQTEIDNDRPIHYFIYNHAIVCDGWRTDNTLMFYHMNYGWGGGNNGWYAVDGLFCNWTGCDPQREYMYTNIYPDREFMFYADTIIGTAPLDIAFTSSSDRTVKNWSWEFGDGTTSETQNPVHTYDTAGMYNVSLTMDYGNDETRGDTRTDYIYVLADSLWIADASGDAGGTVEVVISARNDAPLEKITLPVLYGGTLSLTLDSLSTVGCRTADFDTVYQSHIDPANKRATYILQAYTGGYYAAQPWLLPGTGDIARLYFTISPSGTVTQEATITVGDYMTHALTFHGDIYGFKHLYQPMIEAGTVAIDLVCGDPNDDNAINLLDILYLIDFIYGEGDPPQPATSGDVNADGATNLLDLLYLIDFLYGTPPGPAPNCL
ncbi:MAG: C10 family peptidase [candidate division Zixibacteria bacterium]|nr:C10 family peptidase [candidate division Zixibacteria bacterium]